MITVPLFLILSPFITLAYTYRAMLNSGDNRHCQVVFAFNNHASIKLSNAMLRLVLFIMLKRFNNEFF